MSVEIQYAALKIFFTTFEAIEKVLIFKSHLDSTLRKFQIVEISLCLLLNGTGETELN